MGKHKIGNLVQYIKEIDIFGTPVNLTINYSRRSRTIFGGCLSVLSFVGIIVYACYSVEDFYKKINPTVTKTTSSSTKSSMMINKANFPLAFVLLGYENETFDELDFKIKGYYFEYRNWDWITTKLILRNCEKEDFPLINDSYFYENYMNGAKCIDNLNFEISESMRGWENDAYILINVLNCKKVNETNCDKINKFFDDDGGISVVMSGTEINLNKVKNPFEYYYDYLEVKPNKGLYKELTLKIKKQKLITDDGWIVKKENEENAYVLDKFYIDFALQKENGFDNSDDDFYDKNNIVLSITIEPSHTEESIKRIYQKLHNAVADVGGILSILLNIMPMLNFLFSRIKIDEVILNSLFDFDFSNKPIQRIELSREHKNISKSKQTKMNSSNTSISRELKSTRIIEKNNIYNNELDNKIAKIIKIRKGKYRKKLEFTFIEILFDCCLKSKQSRIKRKLYKKSQQTVRNYLEISYIINKLDDLSKIQYAIFSKEQTALFRFISKNLCSIDENKMKNNPINKYRDRFNNDKEMASIYLSYKEALCNGEIFKTKIDDRLMILLNEEIKDNQHYYNIEERDLTLISKREINK